MALPKRKISKSRRDKRRTHQKIQGPNLSTCKQCGEAKLPHHACPSCGTYKGRTVTEPEED
ncbi:MAG TPA: 50S ribosomal protein L32 [Deltaproteobacteria bacterium]|nr:50S ribosomal protein L32 [Deltaproteobacteria bacterium]